MDRKGKDRLERLIDFMAKLPKASLKKFSMTYWLNHKAADHTHKLKGKFIQPGDLAHCGTTACALGWAAVVPAFRRAGLKVERNAFDCDASVRNFKRASKFFSLKPKQAHELFGAPMTTLRHAETPKEWARGAKALVKEWAAE